MYTFNYSRKSVAITEKCDCDFYVHFTCILLCILRVFLQFFYRPDGFVVHVRCVVETYEYPPLPGMILTVKHNGKFNLC